MSVEQVIFYIFSVILVFAALMVVSSRNTVRSALFLVLAFVVSAGLWMLLEAEFLALVLVLVYVGAVMTLFLFVIMMLNLDTEPRRKGYIKYLPIALLIFAVILSLLLLVVGPRHFGLTHYSVPTHASAHYSNVKELGGVLYTQYVYPFELAAVILLVAIVGAISLAFQGRRKRKSQNIREQIVVKREQRIKLIKMPAETNHSGSDS